jgi:hypothetical protein
MKLASNLCIPSAIMAIVSMLVLAMAHGVSGQTAVVYTPMFLFNKGNLDRNDYCTVQEWNKIEKIMLSALNSTLGVVESRRRRRRRRHNRMRRELTTTNVKLVASRNCTGNAQCLAAVTGCATSIPANVTVDNKRHCSAGIAAVDAALMKATAAFSLSCNVLLAAPRKVLCVENVVDCNVMDFTVVKPTNGTNSSNSYTVVAKLNATGNNVICNKPKNGSATISPLTIEAHTKFDLGAVNIVLNSRGMRRIPVLRNRTDTAALFQNGHDCQWPFG